MTRTNTNDTQTDGTEHRQDFPRSGVDEKSLRKGWYVWHVDCFGIEESAARAKQAEESGEEVTIIYEPL